MRQLATEYAQRRAFSERTNEMAAVAHPVGMEVVTARCRNSAEEWRRRKQVDRRAKEVIRARQEKADEDAAARAAHTEDVVRQSAAGAVEKRKRQRQKQAEKNKRQRKNRQVKELHKEWEEELEKKAEAELEAQAMEKAMAWRLRRQQTQVVVVLRVVRRQQHKEQMYTWMAEQFGGSRVQLGRSWCVWRQQCCEPDTSVSGDQKLCVAEMAAEEDAEADSWAEVVAAAEMAQKAANSRARAGRVRSENPLFQSVGAEEDAEADSWSEAVAAATEATMEMAVAAIAVAEQITSQKAAEQTTIREHNPLFQSMGTEEPAMTVTNRVEEVAAMEMTVTAVAAVAATAVEATTATVTTKVEEEATEAEEAADTVATQEEAPAEVQIIGGGANSSQIWDQSKIFDPGRFNSQTL